MSQPTQTPQPSPLSPLATTLEVTLGHDKYEFRIPTLHDEIAIGSRMGKLRRAIDPAWDGYEMGLDGTTQYALRACATLELLLLRASIEWPFSEGPDKRPVVISANFPTDKAHIAVQVYQGFTEALDRFRYGGDQNGKRPGTTAVEGQPDTQ